MFAVFATHPDKGDILSCHWYDIIAPQYRVVLIPKPRIQQELPLKSVGGREKVSLSLMCVIAPTVPPIGLMAAFVAPTAVVLLLVKSLYQLFCFLVLQEHYSNHHGDAHYVALLFSHISFVLKILCMKLSRCMGEDFAPPSICPDILSIETEHDLEKTF
ncbi:hypothetical protein [Desulfosporosinus sp. OT]|uniref:hypothetical protein n=1 Tax=Desulfosporosinus sp. OT TaxID=913865 RepID=UPI001A99416A|nr:hypothetical protein [Desulfosporosinus sp. OT]